MTDEAPMAGGGRWIGLIGINPDGLDGLSPAARRALDEAEAVFGSTRHLALLGSDDLRPRTPWPTPLSDGLKALATWQDHRVAVLASGDPWWQGIGPMLARHFGVGAIASYPAPSAFSLAAARLGWALQHTRTISLHDRPVAHLSAELLHGRRLLCLTRDETGPGAIADRLVDAGFRDASVHVMEVLGGPAERITSATAATLPRDGYAALNVVAIETGKGTASAVTALPHAAAGLSDDVFEHDGQMTKRAVRAMTIAALEPRPGQCLWDLGAGCGSVVIEWARLAECGQAVAVEKSADRVAMIRRNADRLGVPDVMIHQAESLEVLHQLPDPDSIFIGGGIGADLIERCWARLPTGGRIVANAVTLDGQAELIRAAGHYGGSLSEAAISIAADIGPHRAWRPQMPVIQWAAQKTGNHSS